MDETLKKLLTSGTALVADTKQAKTQSMKAPKKGLEPLKPSMDPHETLIKRCIEERISKRDVVEEFKKIIKAEEALL